MKTLIVAIVALMATTAAQADGFNCKTLDGSISVKIFNNTDPSAGTRNAAVMIISDELVSEGRKTIAKFSDTNETLGQSGASYVADVDHRYNDSGRKGELLLGTKIGYIKTIAVDVDFSYSNPVANGKKLAADLTIVKRNGETFVESMSCKRYLKN